MDSHKDQVGIDLGEHLMIWDPETGATIRDMAIRAEKPKQKPKKNGEQNEQ